MDGDNDFKNSDIGINRNDNYMTLFVAKFSSSGRWRLSVQDVSAQDDYDDHLAGLETKMEFSKEATLIQRFRRTNLLFGIARLIALSFPGVMPAICWGKDIRSLFAHGEGWGAF